MTTIANIATIDMMVADMKTHPGQWTIVGQQVPTSRGRAFAKRGCQVIYRMQTTPGTADVIARWPERR